MQVHIRKQGTDYGPLWTPLFRCPLGPPGCPA
jgi:hypothetical protein